MSTNAAEWGCWRRSNPISTIIGLQNREISKKISSFMYPQTGLHSLVKTFVARARAPDHVQHLLFSKSFFIHLKIRAGVSMIGALRFLLHGVSDSCTNVNRVRKIRRFGTLSMRRYGSVATVLLEHKLSTENCHCQIHFD